MKNKLLIQRFLILTLAMLGARSSTPALGDEPIDKRFPLPAAPTNGFQIVTPDIVIPAHGQRQICWWTTLPNQTDIKVPSATPFQGEGGHHFLALMTTETQQEKPDGTVEDCTEGNIAGATRWSALTFPNARGNAFQAPAGYAVVIPAHARYVFSLHYHNHEARPVLVRDVMNFDVVPTANFVNVKPMATWLTSYAGFAIPAGRRYDLTYECPVTKDLDLALAMGHMHDFAVAVDVQIDHQGSVDSIIHVDPLDPRYAIAAGMRYWPTDAPYKVHVGDKLRVTCSWVHHEDHEVRYPDEMCAAIFFQISSAEPFVCNGTPVKR